MPKNLFQDMVKVKRMARGGERKSLPESTERVPRVRDVPEEKTENIFIREPKMVERDTFVSKEEGGGGSRRKLWFVAAFAVVFFLFALSFLFSSATITVNPKVREVALNEDLSAVKEVTKDDDLPFDLVVIPGQVQKKVQGQELTDVLVPARGTVVIYNAFSTASQNLNINTRLEGSNGKIYKTEKALTVPGMKGTTPGSVEAAIYGAEGGDAYNSPPLDFKVFGFKGTPKYAKFYARSKGAITGGLKGKSPILSDKEKAALHNSLQLSLQDSLKKKAISQIPDGFILFQDAVTLNTENESFSPSPVDGSISASMNGTLYGILFNEQKLTGKLAQTKIDGYDGSDVFIPNIKDLVFLLTTPVDFANSQAVTNIGFNLSGPANFVYKVDENKLTNDLLGKSKSNFNQVLSSYPNIESAQTTISPFWKMSFPDTINKIKVIVNYPK